MLRKQFNVTWISMFMSNIMYVVVGQVLFTNLKGGPVNAGAQNMSMMFAAVGVALLATGLIWPSRFLGDDVLQKAGSLAAAAQKVYTNSVISLALLESVTVFALVGVFISHNKTLLIPTALVSMGAMLYQRGGIQERFDRAEHMFPE